jgi:hypothetical protein
MKQVSKALKNMEQDFLRSCVQELFRILNVGVF